jgi:hypothetical protein
MRQEDPPQGLTQTGLGPGSIRDRAGRLRMAPMLLGHFEEI